MCVEARATEDPHYERTTEERSEGNPLSCADYCEIGGDESDKTDKQTCLVARNTGTKAMFVVRQNLPDAFLTQYLGCLSSLLVTIHNILVDLSCQGCGLAWEGCFE